MSDTPGKGVASFAGTHFRRLREAFEQDENADLTIVCKGREWKVSKMILCLSSEVFKKMLCGGFKEAAAPQIELDSEDPDALDLLLRHMYSFQWSPLSYKAAESSRLILKMRVAKIADFYGVESLQRDAVNDFCSTIKEILSQPELVDAINEAYTHDGYGQFREILARSAARRLSAFRDDIKRYETFWNAVSTHHEFAVAMLRASPEKAPIPPVYKRRMAEDSNDAPAKRLQTSYSPSTPTTPAVAPSEPRRGGRFSPSRALADGTSLNTAGVAVGGDRAPSDRANDNVLARSDGSVRGEASRSSNGPPNALQQSRSLSSYLPRGGGTPRGGRGGRSA